MNIYCFGDSITFGEYDTEKGGWVNRLKIDCMAHFIARGEAEKCVFNLGIGGETTRLMRPRFKRELETRLENDQASLVILAYGANDAAEINAQLRVPLPEYVENLDAVIDEARSRKCEVGLVNITPVAPVADGVRNPAGRLRSNTVIRQYNTALADLARRQSAVLIDANSAFHARGLSSLFVSDGVHPNADGHALIHELIRKRL